MLRIHERLQAGAYPNCVGLARQLDVSLRTVKRDVEFMMERLQLPITYDSRRRGFRYRRPVERFPSLPITESEMFALLVAHKAIAQYRGTPFEQPLAMAFRKLTGQLDTRDRFSLDNLQDAVSFRPFAPDDADLHRFQVITQALQERRVLRFRYKNLGSKPSRLRTVRPYHLACIENHWYLFGFDTDRQAIRTFSLSRLTDPQPGEERFASPSDFRADDYLRGSLSVFKGRDDYEVVIEFDAWATDLVRGRHWHASQDLIELPDGCSRLRLRLNSLEEIERWVLSWGLHATVVRPRALVERVGQIGATLATRYSSMAVQPFVAGATKG